MSTATATSTCSREVDVDGDGDLDLFAGGGGQRLYVNDGSGSFTEETAARMPLFSGPATCVAFGDVDGDGDLDLFTPSTTMVGPFTRTDIRLLVNDGAGVFALAAASQVQRIVAIFQPSSLVLGDVDADGDLDLVVGNAGSSFAGWQNVLLTNDGTGSFSDVTASHLPALDDMTRSVALGDLDGDQDLDLVVCNLMQRHRVLVNDGTGRFPTASDLAADVDRSTSLVLGDGDGDGDLDVVVGNGGSYPGRRSRLYLNDGVGRFVPAARESLPVAAFATTGLALGDLDGDGDLDLVLGTAADGLIDSGKLATYTNNGVGTFVDTSATRLPAQNQDYRLVPILGDVDTDGDLDLIVPASGLPSAQNRLYLNDGAGGFSDVTASHVPLAFERTMCGALGDVDGDGDLDFVAGNSGQQNRLYLNDGTGVFADHTASRFPADSAATNCVAFGDVDGDGDLDVVFGNSGQANRLYANDGSGNFVDVSAGRLPAGAFVATAVVFADVDRDGDLDLVFAAVGQNRLHLNDGSGTFSDATATRMPAVSDTSASVAAADFDEDGDLDLLIANTENTFSGVLGQQNRLLLNDGLGTFTDATSLRLPVDQQQSIALAVGDVDSDGDLDVVVGNLGKPEQLYRNLLRQLDAPFLLRAGRPFVIEAYSRAATPSAFDVAFGFLSTTRQSLPLPPYGVLGIDPMVALLPIWIPSATGSGGTVWSVPNQPALVGLELSAQAAIVRWSTEIRLSNVVADELLR
ncbi:MAG: VCBS repeat-containing protein, partial [Planctomycetes bacterium]|nr:VCBS repeat-containing protein [Planctomycetota bacterium]